MPRVLSHFLKKTDTGFEYRTAENCCAFLLSSATDTKFVGYHKGTGVPVTLLKWWIKFLGKVGIPAKYEGTIQLEALVPIRSWNTQGDLLLPLPSGMNRSAAWRRYSGTIDSTADYLTAPREGTRKKLPFYVISYTTQDRGGLYCGKNLLIHTALRYAWHGEGIELIKTCKRLTEETNFTPYQILIIAHRVYPISDGYRLINLPHRIWIPQEIFLQRLEQSGTVMNTFEPFGDSQSYDAPINKYLLQERVEALKLYRFREFFSLSEQVLEKYNAEPEH
jgi:hypothetical protein